MDVIESDEFEDGQYSDQSGSDGSDDYSDDGDEEDYEEEELGHDQKRLKGQQGGKFALPSKEEQMHLRETENLMRTNLLKLQVDEMLREVKDETYANKHGFIEWINTLRDAIPTLGADITAEVSMDWLHSRGIKCLNLDGYESSQLRLRYSPPVSSNFIGSFLHKTSTKPFLCVDLAVSMPSQCFEGKDITNHVYFDKRKLYLGALLQELQKPVNTAKFGSELYVTVLKGDSRKPVIVLKPSKKTPYLVRLFPTLPIESEGFPIKLSQLRASKNNVRPTYWMQTLRENERLRKEAVAATNKKGKSSKKAVDSDLYSSSHLDSSMLEPTPCYNMAILEDLAMPSMASAINGALVACPCLRDSIVLLKVWLTQLGLRNGFDSMDGHEAAVLLFYLYSAKRILPQMTPLLAFTAALKFLAETDFSSAVLSMVASRHATIGDIFNSLSPRPAAILAVVVGAQGVDARGGLPQADSDGEDDDAATSAGSVEYNVFWRWSNSAVEQIQAAAKTSLDILQKDTRDSSDFAFVELFIRKSNFFQQCDLYFHIPVLDRKSLIDSANKSKLGASSDSFEFELARSMDDSLCDLTAWQFASRRAHSRLSEALGDRCRSVRILSAPVPSEEGMSVGVSLPQLQLNSSSYFPLWGPDVVEGGGHGAHLCYVTIGIILNRDKSHQRVLKGPSAEDEAGCQLFRSFWGSRTQLRRFHDGTIVEACVWGSDAHQTGNQVPRGEIITTDITTFVLDRHLPHNCKHGIRSVCTQLEAYLPASVDASSGLLVRPDPVVGSSAGKGFYPAPADAATLCRRAVEAADALRSIVTSKIQGMPLPIEAFRPTSPALRYSSYFPALDHPLVLTASGEGKDSLRSHSGERISTMIHVCPVVLQMHRSGKWPAELEALRKVKTAMLLRLSENLKLQFQIRSVVNRNYLDVMYKGFVFRMRLFTENEVSLLMPKSAMSLPAPVGDAATAIMPPVVSAEADKLVRNMVIAPLHHSVIHATHADNPTLGDTIRLLVRWVAGHSFSGHIDHETLELIAASVYLEAQKHNTHLQSATAGFLRSLRKIAEFEWEGKPLIVDFTGGEMPAKDIDYIRSSFGSQKAGISKQLPMHIVASYDKQRGYAPGYGLRSPERVVLRMIVAAARSSADDLSRWMARGSDASGNRDLEVIMNDGRMITSRFNAVIKINRSVVSKAQSKSQYDGLNKWLSAMYGPSAFHTKLFSNLSSSELAGNGLSFRDGNAPNSIQEDIFRHLNEKFGSYALFFWDSIAGDRIGIVWKPQAFLPKRFSVLETRLRLPVADDDRNSAVAVTILNAVELVALIISEFDGLVETVDYL